MINTKKLIAVIVVSLALTTTVSFAGPTEKTPPVSAQTTSETTSFSDWFYSLFEL